MINKKKYVLALICIGVALITISFMMKLKKEVVYNDFQLGKIAICVKGEDYVPVNEFGKNLHYIVEYNSENKTITVSDARDNLKISLDGEVELNGSVLDEKVNIVNKKGVVYVPVEFLENKLGFEVVSGLFDVKIKGINIYRFERTGENYTLYMYNKYKTYKHEYWSIPDSKYLEIGEQAGYYMTSFRKESKKPVMREVYRTKNGNDVVEIYKYNGESIFPEIDDIYVKYDIPPELTTDEIGPYVNYNNQGLVLAFDRIPPSKKDIEFYKVPYSKHDYTNGLLVFKEAPISGGLMIDKIRIFDDKIKYPDGFQTSDFIDNKVGASDKAEIITRVESLDSEKLVLNKRVQNDTEEQDIHEILGCINGDLDGTSKRSRVEK